MTVFQQPPEKRIDRCPVKPTRFIDSVNCAIDGILYATRTQRHMRAHFVAAAATLVVALLLQLPALEFTLLAVSIAFVLFAELLNTAVETAVDLVTQEYHPVAKLAKDVAAGAVLVSAAGAAVTGYLVLSGYIFPLYRKGLEMIGTTDEVGTLVAVLVVVIGVVITKARSGRGTPMHGGMLSGHAAVAFSIATAVTMMTRDPLASILTLSLAVMVSHSRLLMRIHSMREVVCGGVLGVGVTATILLLFRFLHG